MHSAHTNAPAAMLRIAVEITIRVRCTWELHAWSDCMQSLIHTVHAYIRTCTYTEHTVLGSIFLQNLCEHSCGQWGPAIVMSIPGCHGLYTQASHVKSLNNFGCFPQRVNSLLACTCDLQYTDVLSVWWCINDKEPIASVWAHCYIIVEVYICPACLSVCMLSNTHVLIRDRTKNIIMRYARLYTLGWPWGLANQAD